MADIIQLLPDAIANQIAAGEVIQRPASVLKELVENSIDAGSTKIKIIIKEAGKGLIQVIDNGCGMSETDARMSFERHATSKIRKASDLFAIRTMGFRGEAMASIAAVAQMEMKTRKHADELGVKIVIEGSEIKSQEACQCVAGTSISVKNLFFNIPARRRFLKSNTVEMRRILDEFQRIAIANPDVFFSLHHNNTEIFHLPSGNLRQRIVSIFGNSCNKKLVPVREDTDVMKLFGFVGKPEFAKKVRGEQLFFVNQRFIKSGYLHHAIMGAYENLLPKDTYPLYVVFIEIDPSIIDINVHPTKQEIKFDDEHLVYNYLKVAVRHALGQYSVTPTLDFSPEHSFSQHKMAGQRSRAEQQRSTEHPSFNNKTKSSSSSSNGSSFAKPSQREKNNLQNWESLYEGLDQVTIPSKANNIEEHTTENNINNTPSEAPESLTIGSEWTAETPLDDDSGSFSKQRRAPYQIHNTYIVSQIKSGFLLIDQQAAHERILYEQYLSALNTENQLTQKTLFATTLDFSPINAAVLTELLPQVNQLGFDISYFGGTSFIVNGVPAHMSNKVNEQKVIEELLEQYKYNMEMKLDAKENIARSMARSAAIKRGQSMTNEEMKTLIDKLFACSLPFKSPSGKNCFLTYDLEELAKQFAI